MCLAIAAVRPACHVCPIATDVAETQMQACYLCHFNMLTGIMLHAPGHATDGRQ
jgi:hypothetical protein